jgi:hypothetical protein
MKTIDYHTRDKSTWGPGPWRTEPDKTQWQDEATGLPCLIVRNGMGALCGYVGVPAGHPAHGKGYDDLLDIEVHGGLTFAAECSQANEATSVCHVPDPGEPDDVWWLGFDCAHLGDQTPASELGLDIALFGRPSVYRDYEYVTNEVTNLAAQLKALRDPTTIEV